MPLAYLLDTDILSDLVRHPQGIVATRITAAGENTVCTSIVVAAELPTIRVIALNRMDLSLEMSQVLVVTKNFEESSRRR